MKAHLREASPVVLLAVLLAHASLAAERTVVFTNANLIPMTSETVLADRAVIVRGTRIAEVVPSEGLQLPAGAELIDCRGAYLMPGLADMHVHLDAYFPTPYYAHPYFNLFLANGVTTIRDLAQGSPPSVLGFRRELEEGSRLGPTVYVANTYWGSEPDVLGLFLAQQPLGYDCAKLNSYLSPEEFGALVERAHEMRTYTLGHIPYAVGLDGVLAAGMNEVTHVDEVILSEMIGLNHDKDQAADQWDQEMVAAARQALSPYVGLSVADLRKEASDTVREIMDRLRGKDITFTTTLVCDEDTADKLFHRQRLESASHAPYISPQFWKALDAGKDKHQNLLPKEEWGGYVAFSELGKMLAFEMKRNGTNLVLGTDVGPPYLSLVPGFSLHDELALLTSSGFTPYEALLTSTRNASAVVARMTGKDEFGTIEEGKRADLVLVEGNPLTDLACVRKPLGVMAAGRWLPADTLAALAQVVTKRIDDRLESAYDAGGIEAAIGEYRAIKQSNRYNQYYYSAATLNNAAYLLLGNGRADEAIRMFELNAAEYPEDPNSYDSLAEGYMKKGDNERAIELYRKSLAMNPGNTNAVDMLKTLGAN
jgi:imidazolonepropionase-like amidohydrolase